MKNSFRDKVIPLLALSAAMALASCREPPSDVSVRPVISGTVSSALLPGEQPRVVRPSGYPNAVFDQLPATGVTSMTLLDAVQGSSGGAPGAASRVRLQWKNGDTYEGDRVGRRATGVWTFSDGTKLITKDGTPNFILASGEVISGPWTTPVSAAPNIASYYPAISRREHEEGQVLVAFIVLENGDITDMQIMQSSGHPRLDEASLTLTATRHFTAGRMSGRPVKSHWVSDIVWRVQ